jgi:hypothetical protein
MSQAPGQIVIIPLIKPKVFELRAMRSVELYHASDMVKKCNTTCNYLIYTSSAAMTMLSTEKTVMPWYAFLTNK